MITLTEAAVTELKKIIASEAGAEAENMALRVYVAGGGCSGFSYGMALDEPKEGDSVHESDGIKVVVDPMSLRYLDGAEIDYKGALMGGGFAIRNPNAKSTCGCGSSFQTEDDSGQARPCGM